MTLHHIATHSLSALKTLFVTHTIDKEARYCYVPPGILLCVALCCSVFQCAPACGAMFCGFSVLKEAQYNPPSILLCVVLFCSVLQCVAVCCTIAVRNTVQHSTATHFNKMPSTATHPICNSTLCPVNFTQPVSSLFFLYVMRLCACVVRVRMCVCVCE